MGIFCGIIIPICYNTIVKITTPIPREQQKNAKMPDFLKRYFWDVDFATLDPDKYSTYVIERLLDIGDIDATAWLFKTYPKNDIKEIVKNTRQLSKKSLNYWLTILDLEKWKKQALARKQNVIWNY